MGRQRRQFNLIDQSMILLLDDLEFVHTLLLYYLSSSKQTFGMLKIKVNYIGYLSHLRIVWAQYEYETS